MYQSNQSIRLPPWALRDLWATGTGQDVKLAKGRADEQQGKVSYNSDVRCALSRCIKHSAICHLVRHVPEAFPLVPPGSLQSFVRSDPAVGKVALLVAGGTSHSGFALPAAWRNGLLSYRSCSPGPMQAHLVWQPKTNKKPLRLLAGACANAVGALDGANGGPFGRALRGAEDVAVGTDCVESATDCIGADSTPTR